MQHNNHTHTHTVKCDCPHPHMAPRSQDVKMTNYTLVETMPFDRRVVGSNPALAAT